MHIKHLKHGTGSGADAESYLMDDTDHQGRDRGGVEVLRGDPQHVAVVVDSLDTKWKYSSGVIAWHPDDNPTPEQIEAVLDDYERAAFSGMESDRYAFSAVLHREPAGHLAVHTFAARVDLATGKSFNPAPPNHHKIFDQVRDYHNKLNGWKSPDPTWETGPAAARERSIDPLDLKYRRQLAEHDRAMEAHRADPQQQPHPGEPPEPPDKAAIHEWIIQRVDSGMIENRDDIRESLQKIGEITRQGKNYISVKPDGAARAIRLKGGVYSEQFSRAAAIEAAERHGLSRPAGRKELAALGIELSRALERRAEYNRKRYGEGYCQPEGTNKECNPSNYRRHEGDHGSERVSQTWARDCRDASSEDTGLVWSQDDDSRYGSLTDHLRRYLGNDSIFRQSADLTAQTVATNQGNAPCNIRRADLPRSPQRGRDRDIRGRTDGNPPKLTLEQYKQQLASHLFQSNILLEEIRWVDLNHRQIQFADGGSIFVTAIELSAVGMSAANAARRLTAGAIANGWKKVELSGSDSFIHKAALELLKSGIEPNAKDQNKQRLINRARSEYECFRAAINQAYSKNESRAGNVHRAVKRSHSVVGEAVNSTSLAGRKIEWTSRRREGGKKEISGIFRRLERFRMGLSQKINNLSCKLHDAIRSSMEFD